MNQHTVFSWGPLLAVLVTSGCDSGGNMAAKPVSAALQPDACAIALAPHSGSERVDQEISRRQQLARQSDQSVAQLERLGWAFVTKARTSFDPGFYRLAEQSALCIEVAQPHSAESLLLRGHVLHSMHRFIEAETLARELIAQRGLSFDYGLLGDVLMEQGKLAEAAEAYQAMMDQRPGSQAYIRAAHLRWLTGDLPGAIELMRMTVGATSARDPEAAAWAIVRLAHYEWQAGHTDQTNDLLAAALALQPDYPPALIARGRLLLAAGEADQAVAPLERAVNLDRRTEYQWALIEALRTSDRGDAAGAVEADLMERGSRDDPRTFSLYLATTGVNVARALQLAREELAVRGDAFTLDALAWALRAAGLNQEARTYSRRALADGTIDARLIYHAGIIAAESGELKEATHWFEKAMAIQHMLLPSERGQLRKESAAVESRITTLAAD